MAGIPSALTRPRQAVAGRSAAQRRLLLAGAIKHAVLIAISVLFLLPWAWMLSTSLKPLNQLFLLPPIWVPHPVVWQNYPAVFQKYPFLLYGRNTLTIAFSTVIGAVLSNTLIAYSLGRLRWPGRDVVFILVLATLMLPFQVTMIPLYVIFRHLHWLDTFLPLIVPSFFGSAYYAFLLRQFFMTIPPDLSDAASIDGASELQVLWRVVLPLARPALAVVALFQFIFAWNDFLGPLIYINQRTNFTIAIGLREMQNAVGLSDINTIMAASAMTILPIILVFFFAQRTFIQGIALTGLKG
jgi:multiple sugar transport system permease protein